MSHKETEIRTMANLMQTMPPDVRRTLLGVATGIVLTRADQEAAEKESVKDTA